MKRVIGVVLAASLIVGCGRAKTIDGKKYSTYGFFNADSQKNDKIRYEVSIRDVILSVVFCETLIVPILICGLDIMEPVDKGGNNPEKGVIPE